MCDFTLARSSENTSHSGSSQHSFRSDAKTWFQLRRQAIQRGSGPKRGGEVVPEGWGSPDVDTCVADYLPSPFYAAPELFRAGLEFSVAADLWSLGCVVFEMLTGEQPFCGSSLDELEGAVCGGDLVREEGLAEWEDLVHGLLIKSPKQRYITHSSFWLSFGGVESVWRYRMKPPIKDTLKENYPTKDTPFQPFYKGQNAWSQTCPLFRGSTVCMCVCGFRWTFC